MFSRIVRYQLPFKTINTSRPFITSTFVCNHKKEESGHKKEKEKKKDSHNHKENGGNQQNDHSQNDHSQSNHKPQEEKPSQPSLEEQLKECNTKYKALQVKKNIYNLHIST